MRIQVLGTGCKNCSALEASTYEALQQLGMNVTVDKVTDYQEIVAHGVMSTPALVIDEVVKTTGRVPSVQELTDLLSEAAT